MKKKKNIKKQRKKSNREKRNDRLAFWFFLVFLFMLWTTFFSHIISKNYFGHTNYMGQQVGTFLLLPLLIVAPFVFIYVVWKHSRGEDVINRTSDEPEWMKKPPYKWPWQ